MFIHFKIKRFAKSFAFSFSCMLFLSSFCIILKYCVLEIQDISKLEDAVISIKNRYNGIPRSKYVLMWDRYSLILRRSGQNIFPEQNCSVSNCIFTANRYLLDDYTHYDAVLFNFIHLEKTEKRPTQRSNTQIYIFTSIESSANWPACQLSNDGFYNWTFTYRLDSDVVWNYFVVLNVTGDIVAPSKDVKWVDMKNYIDPKVRSVLKGRTKAAAWFVSHCNVDSFRDDYLTKLHEHLFQYSLTLDVYGKCTKNACENDNCEEMLKNKYYFYMAFENSFAEDYVTEKILHGYNNYVVPIVYGDANYSRFLPPGSYINARDHNPYNLAKIIYDAMNKPILYESYFKWTNYYTIKPAFNQYHPLCKMCEALNSKRVLHAPAKKNFRFWWNRLQGMKWCLSLDYWRETARLNVDNRFVHSSI